MIKQVLAGLAALLLASSMAYAQIDLGDAQAGDLIFRQGTEDVSLAVISLDGGPYSHVGMLLGRPGHWQVLHATPSEVPGRADGVVEDSLEFFLSPTHARLYAVYHVDSDDGQRQHAIQAAQAMLATPFRVADPNGTYCTKLVWNAWQQAGVDMQVQFTHLNLPLMPGEYLMPNGLLASDKLTKVIANSVL